MAAESDIDSMTHTPNTPLRSPAAPPPPRGTRRGSRLAQSESHCRAVPPRQWRHPARSFVRLTSPLHPPLHRINHRARTRRAAAPTIPHATTLRLLCVLLVVVALCDPRCVLIFHTRHRRPPLCLAPTPNRAPGARQRHTTRRTRQRHAASTTAHCCWHARLLLLPTQRLPLKSL